MRFRHVHAVRQDGSGIPHTVRTVNIQFEVIIACIGKGDVEPNKIFERLFCLVNIYKHHKGDGRHPRE